MAATNGNSKVVVQKYSITFNGTDYDVMDLPPGVPTSCEPSEVTVGSDVEQRFDKAGITEDGDIVAKIAGTPPELNTKAALTLKLTKSTAGGAATQTTVSIGTCIVTGSVPATIEVGGNRVLTYEVTFKPSGDRT